MPQIQGSISSSRNLYSFLAEKYTPSCFISIFMIFKEAPKARQHSVPY